jgi:F0F1-type ATP synthase assembly protein I
MQNFIRYSGVAFTMAAVVGGFTWFGYWLDGRYHNETPWFTLVFSLLSVPIAIYYVLKDFTKSSQGGNDETD